jgi:hypothetical protein
VTNRELRRALLKRLNITPQALSLRAGKMKRQHGPMSTEDATYVIAHAEGIDLSKYLSAEEVSRIRTIRPGRTETTVAVAPARRGKEPVVVAVAIGRDISVRDPVLPRHVLLEAKIMAERVYPKLYLLENSAREVILRVMNAAHGEKWWGTHAPSKVRDTVAKRKADEDRRPWHGKRGVHEIFYTDIDDLKSIVNSNYNVFKNLFPDFTWFGHIVDVVTPSRNVSSHHNPLSPDDIKRLEVYFRDWQKHLAAHEGDIP